jgi:Caspase domain/Domain of unknown function (DUF4384)
MKMSSARSALLVISGVLVMASSFNSFAAAATAVTSTDSNARSSHALLIAVSDYKESGLQSLNGPENDVSLVRDLIINKFHIPSENIKTLLNKQATHSGIERAFADLANRVKSGDFVYIHYSGHGSTAKDPKDRRGEDQTWVSFGSRSNRSKGNDDHDVLDKEIAIWLQPIYAKTESVVFVSDSCHSATVARGEPRGSRGVVADPRPHPLIGKVPESPTKTVGLRIGAARDFESAVEVDPKDASWCPDSTRCYGVFTMYWAQSLEKAQPGETWNDVFNRTYTLVSTARGVSQRPQREGNGNAAVFGGMFPPIAPSVAVKAIDAVSGTVRLAAGAVMGVTKGSTYRRKDPDVSKGGDTPVLEVTKVDTFESEARPVKGEFQVGDFVIESNHVYSFEPLRLYVGGDFANGIDQPLVQKIRAALKDLSGFSLVEDRGRADWWVYVVRPKPTTSEGAETPDWRLPASTESNPPVAWVVSPQGVLLHDRMRIPVSEPESGIKLLAKNLNALSWSREVKRLGTQGNLLPVSLSVTVHPSKCANASKEKLLSAECVRGTYPLAQVVPPPIYNDLLSFTLENKDQSHEWYAYVVAVGPDAAVQLIYPRSTDNQDEARLDKGKTYSVPSKYRLNAPGTETIVLLVAKTPIDAGFLERPGYMTRGEPKSPLEKLLAAAGRRRGDVETPEESEWGSVEAEFVITRQP